MIAGRWGISSRNIMPRLQNRPLVLLGCGDPMWRHSGTLPRAVRKALSGVDGIAPYLEIRVCGAEVIADLLELRLQTRVEFCEQIGERRLADEVVQLVRILHV